MTTWLDSLAITDPGWYVLIQFGAMFAVFGGAILALAWGVYRVWTAGGECRRPRAPWED